MRLIISRMKPILWIDACIREGSRTRELALAYLEARGQAYQHLDLSSLDIKPINEARLKEREALLAKGAFDDEFFALARQFAEAEEIVISAPFYDGSFPSILKIYFENISVGGICFRYEGPRPVGLVAAKRLVYVYTSGGPLTHSDQAFPYIKTLCGGLYGIPNIIPLSAECLDIDGMDANAIFAQAKAHAKEIAKK